jgi:hypothetical protein
MRVGVEFELEHEIWGDKPVCYDLNVIFHMFRALCFWDSRGWMEVRTRRVSNSGVTLGWGFGVLTSYF